MYLTNPIIFTIVSLGFLSSPDPLTQNMNRLTRVLRYQILFHLKLPFSKATDS